MVRSPMLASGANGQEPDAHKSDLGSRGTRSSGLVQLLIGALVGVLGGIGMAIFNSWMYAGVSASLGVIWPPLVAVMTGIWLWHGFLALAITQSPGTGLLASLVGGGFAALFTASSAGWSPITIVQYALVQGLASELMFGLVRFLGRGHIGVFRMTLVGAGTGIVTGLLDLVLYYSTMAGDLKLGYIGFALISGAIFSFVMSLLAREVRSGSGLAHQAQDLPSERV